MQDPREIEQNPEKRHKEYLDFCDKLVNNLPTNLSINTYLPENEEPFFETYHNGINFDGYDSYDELNN